MMGTDSVRGNLIPQPVAIVTEAELSDEELIREAIATDRREREAPWKIGKLASEWCRRSSRDRSDAKFADLSRLSRKEVNQRRLVWERFGESWNLSSKLSWTHFREALNWRHADLWLNTAAAFGWSVARMNQFAEGALGEKPEFDSEEELIAVARLSVEIERRYRRNMKRLYELGRHDVLEKCGLEPDEVATWDPEDSSTWDPEEVTA